MWTRLGEVTFIITAAGVERRIENCLKFVLRERSPAILILSCLVLNGEPDRRVFVHQLLFEGW